MMYGQVATCPYVIQKNKTIKPHNNRNKKMLQSCFITAKKKHFFIRYFLIFS
jgi:hypothetical protein